MKQSALKIAAVYFIFGILWIFFSDKILSLFMHTTQAYAFAQTVKGWVYVFITAGLVYTMVSAHLARLEKAQKELKENYAKLQEYDKMKTNFIAIISHEMRTPIAVIKGYSTFLKKKNSENLTPEQKAFVEAINENTERLRLIVHDLSDMERIKTGVIRIEKVRFNAADFMNSRIEEIKHSADQNGVRFEPSAEGEDLSVNADPDRLSQAVLNIMNNAVKFSEPGGVVKTNVAKIKGNDARIPAKIRASLDSAKKYILVSVLDHGEGIPEKDREKVFEEFYQSESHLIRKHQGAGVGLFIAAKIMEFHEGKIWAESGEGGTGAKISFVIPAGD
ncbi:MAG: HAMP domain-containing histidine kinase [Candidatus Goldbacteria bacterium]|nr:HAMP domain-containing histidine kinase [Candidatus Goldiibacteriota bacterium]